jgi:hypothetical protein
MILTIVGVLAVISSIAMTLVGFPAQIYLNHKRRSCEGIEPLLVLAALGVSLLWVVYGWLKADWFLAISRGFGMLLAAVIIFQMIRYRHPKFFFRLFIFVVASAVVSLVFYWSQKDGLSHVELFHSMVQDMAMVVTAVVIAVGFSFQLYQNIVKPEACAAFSSWLVLTGFCSYCCWFSYALIKPDFHLAVPESIGFTLVSVFALQFLAYKRRTNGKLKKT